MLCIVQARLSSKRLPAKMLKKILNKTLIDRVLLQISKSQKINKIILATSKHYSDNKLAKYCKNKNIEVYRGSLDNVAERFYEISKKENSDSFLRVNGDSPLIDYRLIDFCIEQFQKNNYDILTNSFPKTFPKGQGVEIIKSKVFQRAFENIKSKKDLEHVFPYFYRNKKKFRFKNIKCKQKLNTINLSIDTLNDLIRIRKLLSKSKNVTLSLNKLINKNIKLY
jgi:spore coat polysaccharide biosynthesis protein SpsF